MRNEDKITAKIVMELKDSRDINIPRSEGGSSISHRELFSTSIPHHEHRHDEKNGQLLTKVLDTNASTLHVTTKCSDVDDDHDKIIRRYSSITGSDESHQDPAKERWIRKRESLDKQPQHQQQPQTEEGIQSQEEQQPQLMIHQKQTDMIPDPDNASNRILDLPSTVIYDPDRHLLEDEFAKTCIPAPILKHYSKLKESMKHTRSTASLAGSSTVHTVDLVGIKDPTKATKVQGTENLAPTVDHGK
jgi:hypothetical protein